MTGNLLTQILRRKREDVAELLRTQSEDATRRTAFRVRENAEPHRLRKALQAKTPELKIIAEYKRLSPSKGPMRAANLSPAQVASLYEKGGACAISVLTEKHFFGGSIADLKDVREVTQLPVLRKDFVFHRAQILEAAEAGADAVLLIVAALDEEMLLQLRLLAEDELGLDALVEVHTAEEMRRAENAGAQLIGINNRDLSTFDVSFSTSELLVKNAPANALLISESGLSTHDELHRLHQLGFAGFLVGGSLMQSDDPGAALQQMLGAEESAAAVPGNECDAN